ncbi:hypothetical protein [Ectothiorhodospira shaposhnikovii]|uniref:hypothetical protein n=1 Tax=Ectothiorhodospira shaposhnikovii TaxID=1054 RepID=UPI001EE8F998|nr:hypothetical protein [Ectothiorhodospira shaposhnikovii]MCG5512325.1 hypothetical protein [Ectothiorhodospira shaposhnikovii]
MLIEQSLAGIRLPWRFPGSFNFFHSAASKCGSGQLFLSTVQIGHSPKNDIVNQVIRIVRNLDWTCLSIPWDINSTVSPIQSLNRQLHGCDSSSKIELLHHMDRELRGNGPTAIIAILTSQDESEEISGVFSQLYSDLDKIRAADQTGLSLGLVCFCPTHDNYQLDVTRGLPVVSPDPLLSGPDEFAWNAYLHHRVAWEVGGQVDSASELASMTAGMEIGDDNAFEELLNRQASIALSKHGLSADACIRILERWLRGQDAFITQEHRDLLTWRPQATTRYLKPYVARAILLNRSISIASDLKDAIRSATVCQPLIGCLFSATLEIEYRQRPKHTKNAIDRLDQAIIDKAKKMHSEFCDRDFIVERLLYPSTSRIAPCGPDDWPGFLSYGQVVPRDERAFRLRNALAHGHPPSWQGVALLRQCIDDYRLKE